MAFIYERIKAVWIGCGILLLLLAGRLLYLQLIAADSLAARGLAGRIQGLEIGAMRGEIYDRNFKPLTNVSKRLTVTFFPGQCKDPKQVAALLSAYGHAAKEDVEKMIAAAKRPIKILDGITAKAAEEIKAMQLSGVVVSETAERYGFFASHLIGYANRSDNRGASGLEAEYDDVLRGPGQEYLAAALDAQANLIPGLSYRKLSLGFKRKESLVLTIDKTIQEKAERVFDAYASQGAVVIMEPYSGHVLAMVSRPNFNAEDLAASLSDQRAPLINRAITAYQPGSVMKLAVAAAALEKGKVRAEEHFLDKGYIDVGGTVFNGWDLKAGVTERTFHDAIVYSSNPVLIETGLRIGMKDLVEFLEKLGFGAASSLNFYGEARGNLPDKENFYLGELANLSIGQGECESTPLQIAQMVATIVNDGVKVNPLLVQAVVDEERRVTKKYQPVLGERVFSARNASLIRKMMEDVTARGTGQAAFVSRGGSAGKTGSAETGRVDKEGKSINHAWFAGYAPLKKPRYVVVVFVENGMSGGDVAAPIFKKIVEAL